MLFESASVAFARGDAKPWDFVCTYYDRIGNISYEEGDPDSIDAAQTKAYGACTNGENHVLYSMVDIVNGFSNHCVDKGCKEPKECPPVNIGDLELTQRALRCQISKINGQIQEYSLAISKEVQKKIVEKHGSSEYLALLVQKRSVEMAREVVESYTSEFTKLSQEIGAFATEARAWTASIPTLNSSLAALSGVANETSWRNLVVVMVSVESMIDKENDNRIDVEARAWKLRFKTRDLCERVDLALAPFNQTLRTQNYDPREALSPVCGKGKEFLDRVLAASSQERVSLERTKSLSLAGLRFRIEALQFQEVDAQTLPARRQASLMAASARFYATVNARIEAVRAQELLEGSPEVELVARRVGRLQEYVRWAALCSQPSQPWMESGCLLAKRQVEPSRRALLQTIPDLVRQDLASLRPEFSARHRDEIEKAQSLVTTDLNAAALIHDGLMRQAQKEVAP